MTAGNSEIRKILRIHFQNFYLTNLKKFKEINF